jgi:hypothetical protein
MYIFGFFFFLGTYIVNKILLILFYKKKITFSREIPEHCVFLLKYTIFLKLACGLLMFLNPDILSLRDSQSSYFYDHLKASKYDSRYNQYGYQKFYLKFAIYYTVIFFSGSFALEMLLLAIKPLIKWRKASQYRSDPQKNN